MVLLGAWALIGLRISGSPSQMNIPGAVEPTSSVLGVMYQGNITAFDQFNYNAQHTAWPALLELRHPVMVYPEIFSRRIPPNPMPLTLKLGRVSAWICTVLYITSRLPQIWTNYKRRSVRGLSIFLFISAFLANLLYSINVLASPRAVGPGSRAFLTESIPFLLGSGGTLVFDFVILIQWIMWRKRSLPNKQMSRYGATEDTEA